MLGARRACEDNVFLCVPIEQALIGRLINIVLNIMVIAWHHSANYWDMQEWLLRIGLEILKRFKEKP